MTSFFFGLSHYMRSMALNSRVYASYISPLLLRFLTTYTRSSCLRPPPPRRQVTTHHPPQWNESLYSSLPREIIHSFLLDLVVSQDFEVETIMRNTPPSYRRRRPQRTISLNSEISSAGNGLSEIFEAVINVFCPVLCKRNLLGLRATLRHPVLRPNHVLEEEGGLVYGWIEIIGKTRGGGSSDNLPSNAADVELKRRRNCLAGARVY